MQRRTIDLSEKGREELIEHRDHDPRPYVSERCAAVIKVAEGQAPHSVALHGLLKSRDPDTVYSWLDIYETEGLEGLIAHQHGGYRRGSLDSAKEKELRERLRRSPEASPDIEVTSGDAPAIVGDVSPTRWTLKRIQSAFDWLTDYTLSGVWRLLRRLGIRLRQGRPQQFSPDPEYEAKERRLLEVLSEAGANDKVVVLFLDEFSYYHWPLPAPDWTEMDGPPPEAKRAPPGEKRWRIVAALNAQTGRVSYRQAYKIDRWEFIRFLRQVAREYPDAERIYIPLDNWSVHDADDVEAALADEEELSRVELVYLPTYAPWLNPIEKLWDWLKDNVLKMHHLAGRWNKVKQRVEAFLNLFAEASQALLYRVGLAGDGKLARAIRGA